MRSVVTAAWGNSLLNTLSWDASRKPWVAPKRYQLVEGGVYVPTELG